MELSKRIAIICNYELLQERVGGMDYFFWEFDSKCKDEGVAVDWFFPNYSNHGKYSELKIYSDKNKSVESHFLDFCKKNKPQYSHVFTHFLEICSPFFHEAKKLSDTKIIAVDHNPRPLKGYALKKKVQKKIKGILYSRYIDLFIAVSDYTVRELIKDFGFHIKNKIQVIYNGIDLEEIQIRQNRDESKPTFLTACHLRESKGIQDLIQAVFLLPETIKNEIVIDLYGDGPYRLQLENKVKSLGLTKCFNFKGSSSDLKSIYCDYDYLIHPSYEETFCYSVVEALAADIKVITTNEGGNILGIITHLINGFLFDAKNRKELSILISNIWLGNLKITQETRSYVENKFSLKKMVEKHFELVRK